ncbi:MAG: hypothetical protein AAF694_16020 [Bacteroidota bacterium]
MRKNLLTSTLLLGVVCLFATDFQMKKGTPEIQSISKLAFGDQGILFLGDAISAKVFALDLGDEEQLSVDKGINIGDLEGEIGSILGTSAENVLIHDMAVNPRSKNVYFSVSRARAEWASRWQLPNELAHADVLIRLSPGGDFDLVDLENILFSEMNLPNPVGSDQEHRWKKGVKLRVDAITDLSYHAGKIYVAGLSNEEFAASMWVAPFPFEKEVEISTLEIFHGAHGEYETHAPIRTFIPYELNQASHIIAAYLCTPLVTFELDKLTDQDHIKGKTVAEFGSGNYPIDMVAYESNGKKLILMSNSALPLMVFDPKEVEAYEGEITTEVEGYLAGIPYTPKSGSGTQQLDNFNEKYILATQRLPSGKLALASLPKERLTQ